MDPAMMDPAMLGGGGMPPGPPPPGMGPTAPPSGGGNEEVMTALDQLAQAMSDMARAAEQQNAQMAMQDQRLSALEQALNSPMASGM